MSLILEALRKLEREAPSQDDDRKSVVVLAPIPWASARRLSRRNKWLAVAALAVLATVAGSLALALLPRVVVEPEPTVQPASRAPLASPTAAPPDHTPVNANSVPRPPEVAHPTPPPLSTRPAPASTPAASAVSTPAPVPRFVLSAIGDRDGLPIAMINDHVVREGDHVDGALVVRIEADGVDLDVAGVTHRLTF